VDERDGGSGHVFISYAREDSAQVGRLERILCDAGIPVWRSASDLWPGDDRHSKVRAAITNGARAFVACFSSGSAARAKSHQNEELKLAIDEYRLRRPEQLWLIPVRFDDCPLPDLELGAGRMLSSIQCADLFGERFDEQASRLVGAIRQTISLAPAGQAAGTLARALAKPVSLFPRPVLLAGREGLLAGLRDRLAKDAGDGPRIAALYGMGGTGKTSVAVEHAYRHQAGNALTWQFQAEDPDSLPAQFAQLASVLGIMGVRDSRNPVAVVHSWLATCPAPWLLIFDNVAGYRHVRKFLPPAGHGQILITSQSAFWPHGQGIEVGVLDPRPAARFLMMRADSTDHRSAAALAIELGGLPLALEQAAAYAAACGTSLAEYLEQFRQHRIALLSRGEPAGYDKTVATTWSMAFAALETRAPAATSLLRLLACFAPEPVPLRPLLRPPVPADIEPDVAAPLLLLATDLLSAWDAIAALRRYSLVTTGEGGVVVMHRLVQAVTAGQMPAGLAAAWRNAAASLIGAAVPGDAVWPDYLPVLRSLLPHARKVLPPGGPGLARMANTLGRSGDYRTGRDLYCEIARARVDLLGPQHEDTLAARHDLAHWTGLAGDRAAARDQCASLLPVARRIYGPEDRFTLTAWHSLSRWTGAAGDPVAARDQLAELLPLRQRALGPDDPDTLDSRHDLAYWSAQAGDAASARDQLTELLHDMTRLLIPEHQDILTTRHDRATFTGKAGDPQAARNQLTELLPEMTRRLGPEHPDTLITRHHLAHWTGRAGNAAAARDQLTELLPDMRRVLGPEHPRTKAAADSLAYWTARPGTP
jgi:hypothetical protein